MTHRDTSIFEQGFQLPLWNLLTLIPIFLASLAITSAALVFLIPFIALVSVIRAAKFIAKKYGI